MDRLERFTIALATLAVLAVMVLGITLTSRPPRTGISPAVIGASLATQEWLQGRRYAVHLHLGPSLIRFGPWPCPACEQAKAARKTVIPRTAPVP